jgi:hypothetical protein
MAHPLEEHRFQMFTFFTPSDTGLPSHRRPYSILIVVLQCMLTITQLLLQQNALLLLKAPDITICTFSSYILPLHVSTRVDHLQGA